MAWGQRAMYSAVLSQLSIDGDSPAPASTSSHPDIVAAVGAQLRAAAAAFAHTNTDAHRAGTLAHHTRITSTLIDQATTSPTSSGQSGEDGTGQQQQQQQLAAGPSSAQLRLLESRLREVNRALIAPQPSLQLQRRPYRCDAEDTALQ